MHFPARPRLRRTVMLMPSRSSGLATKEEQECYVVFLGPVRNGRAEVGLEFSDSRPAFWRVAFPPEDWSPKHPEARTATHTRAKEK